MAKDIHGPVTWALKHGLVDLQVTRIGGQMAPVTFDLGKGRQASPYSVAPWSPDECAADTPALLKLLRGDFFCLPFGVSEITPHPHGAPANLEWDLVSQTEDTLVLSLDDPVVPASFVKELHLEAGHRAVYIQHHISGLEGKFNFGHHPILEFPDSAEPCEIRTGPFRFGQVYPGAFENPVIGGYSSLQPGGLFTSLETVPLENGGTTSLARYPAREGFEDLVMISAADPEFGWVAVHFPGYVWLAIRNTRELPSTLFWHSNGGRHYPPWNGRHRRRLGIEDVCSYFHEGAEISAQDKLATQGIPTSQNFYHGTRKTIHHIQLVHPLDTGFGAVHTVERDPSGQSIFLKNAEGKSEPVPVKHSFLYDYCR